MNIEQSMELARLDARGAFPFGLYFGFVLRHAELYKCAQSVLNGNRIITLEANEYLHPEHGAYIARNWRRRPELGGTYLLDKAVHDFDLFNQLIGSQPESVASFAKQAHFGSSNEPITPVPEGRYQRIAKGWRGIDSPFDSSNEVYDAQVISTQYQNGALLTFNSNTHTGLVQRRMHIGTDKQSVELDFCQNTIRWKDHHSADAAKTKSFEGHLTGHYGADPHQSKKILEFAKNSAASVTVRQGIEAGLTIMLIEQAAETGQVVDCRNTWAELDEIYARRD